MELCHFPANKNLQFISANRKSPNLSAWRSKPLINRLRHTFPGLTPTNWTIPAATDLLLSPRCLWDSPTSAPLPKRIPVLCRFLPTNKASVQIHNHPKSLSQTLPAQKTSQTFSHWNSLYSLVLLYPHCIAAFTKVCFAQNNFCRISDSLKAAWLSWQSPQHLTWSLVPSKCLLNWTSPLYLTSFHFILEGFVVHSLSHVQLFATLWTVTCQALLFMGFPRQEYLRELPFPSPGDLPDPEIESAEIESASPGLSGGFFTTEPPGKPPPPPPT